MSKPWIVKAFHTGGPYSKDATKLRDSAERFDVPIDIEVIQSCGSWNANTHYKAQSVLRAMADHPDKQYIIHVDVDAWFMQYPALFDDLDCDLGAFYWGGGGTWCSGTIIIRNTSAVKALIKEWKAALRINPRQHGDQVALGRLLDKSDLNILRIPAGYIQGLSYIVPEGEGVIAHDGARKRYVGTRIFTDPK